MAGYSQNSASSAVPVDSGGDGTVLPRKGVEVPCACTCASCGNTKVISMDIPVLRAHAKCAKCLSPEHAKHFPGTRFPMPVSKAKQSKYEPREEDIVLEREEVLKEKERLWGEAWERWQSSLPEKYRDATVSHPKLQQKLRLLKSGHLEVASAVIAGPYGGGKTWNAIGYANDAIKRRYLHPAEVKYGTETEMLASIMNASYKDVSPQLEQLVSGRYSMLVIDEVGRGAWLREEMRPKVFFYVLDKLYSNNKMVVVASNMGKEDFEAYIGAGAMDRLRAMSGYDGIYIDANDKRRMVTKELLDGVAKAEQALEDPFG